MTEQSAVRTATTPKSGRDIQQILYTLIFFSWTITYWYSVHWMNPLFLFILNSCARAHFTLWHTTPPFTWWNGPIPTDWRSDSHVCGLYGSVVHPLRRPRRRCRATGTGRPCCRRPRSSPSPIVHCQCTRMGSLPVSFRQSMQKRNWVYSRVGGSLWLRHMRFCQWQSDHKTVMWSKVVTTMSFILRKTNESVEGPLHFLKCWVQTRNFEFKLGVSMYLRFCFFKVLISARKDTFFIALFNNTCFMAGSRGRCRRSRKVQNFSRTVSQIKIF